MNEKVCYYEGCNENAVVKELCLKHYNLWLGNVTTDHKDYGCPLEKRFWSYVWKPTKDGCWLWRGAMNRAGYGHLWLGEGKFMDTHRISWMLYHGDIPENLQVLHKCDSPSCVNPEHLWLGTQLDNQRDMVKKDRSCRGECHGAAKLTEDEVLKIRKLVKFPFFLAPKSIAQMFNISQDYVYVIGLYKRWNYPEILQKEKEQSG